MSLRSCFPYAVIKNTVFPFLFRVCKETSQPFDLKTVLTNCHNVFYFILFFNIVSWKERGSDEEYVAVPQSHIIQTHQGQAFCKSSLHQVYFSVFHLLFFFAFSYRHTNTRTHFFLFFSPRPSWHSWVTAPGPKETFIVALSSKLQMILLQLLMAVNVTHSNKAPATLYLWDMC